MMVILARLYDFSEAALMRGSPERIASRWQRLRSIAKRLQRLRLRRAVWYAYLNSPFYHRLFDEIGLKPSDIRTLEDFSKIPLTEHHHLSRDSYQFLAVPKSRIFEIVTTSGTTGPAKRVFLTKQDVERRTLLGAVGFSLLGVHRGDVAQVMWRPFGAGSTTFQLTLTLRRLGLLALPMGTIPTPEEQIRSIQENGVTILTGSPSFIHMLTVEGRRYAELDKLGVRKIFLSGEPWPESLREKLREAWNCPFVQDSYTMTEIGHVATECSMFNGLHLNEACVYTEVIDPKTGETMEGEEEGELVHTPLNQEGTPLLRYRSGDISRFILEPCECGRPMRRIARIKGRSDEMVKLGTSWSVFPSIMDFLMFEIPGIVDYQLVVTSDGYKDHLTFRVEVKEPKEDILSLVRAAMLKATRMRYDIQVTKTIAEPIVEVLPPGSLRGDGTKPKRIIDLREK